MRQVWVACGFGQGQRQLSFLESGGKKRHSLPCREETQTRWPLADTYPMNKQTKKESKSVRETQGAARGAERGTSSVTPPWRSPLLCQLPRGGHHHHRRGDRHDGDASSRSLEARVCDGRAVIPPGHGRTCPGPPTCSWLRSSAAFSRYTPVSAFLPFTRTAVVLG